MNHKVCDLAIRYGDALLHLFLSQMADTSVTQVCPVHQHAYYELHIVRRGRRLYRIDRRELLLKEGYLLITPPGVDHEPMDRRDPGYYVITLPFSLEQVEDTPSFYTLFTEALSANALIPICSTRCNASLQRLQLPHYTYRTVFRRCLMIWSTDRIFRFAPLPKS